MTERERRESRATARDALLGMLVVAMVVLAYLLAGTSDWQTTYSPEARAAYEQAMTGGAR